MLFRTLVVIFLLVFAAPAAAQEYVGSLRVEGNQRIESNTVLSYLPLRQGDQIDPDKVDAAIKALYQTGFFSDVALYQDGDTIIVKVKENPIINRIAFEGNDDIEKEDLEREVQVKERNVYTRAKVQADTDRILQLYQRTGRFNASVIPKIVPLEQNRVDLVFEIKEGDQSGIATIRFIGNKKFKSSELREELATRESRWWRIFSTSDYYDPDRLQYDRELLRRFYLNHGYADFRVLTATAELDPDQKQFFITFTVEEGERYKFGKVDLTTSIRNFDPEKLKKEVTAKEGEWYSAEIVDKSIAQLTQAAGDLQYAFANVNPEVKRNKPEKKIDVTFRVEEGTRVFVNRVNVKGNTRTLDEVIRRELLLAEGDPYSLSKIKRSEQKVRDLGYFESVKVSTKRAEAPDRTDLDVEIVEKATGEVSVGAGFSTTDGALADFSIRERNLLGRGQNIRLGATLSQRTQQYDISFTEPYFLGRDLAAGFDIYRTQIDNQDESSFNQDNNGFALRMAYPLSEHLRQRLSYTLQQSEISDVDPTASRFIREQEGKETTSSISQELTYDDRDSKIQPTDGIQIRLINDLAGLGGTVKHLRTRLFGAYYQPIFGDDVIGKIEGEVGYIFGLDDENVRISDRFFLGGDSLRGFAYAGIGPRDMTANFDDALGGNEFWRASTELGFPIGLPNELGIKGHTFIDAGTLRKIDATALPGEDFRDDDSIRLGAGIGLSWSSPFGPIRLDLAKALLKESYDKTELFRFSFGTSF
ncbi:MAG: outer membrane protein assembly factor BamA [Bdellovibrionales bacterium]